VIRKDVPIYLTGLGTAQATSRSASTRRSTANCRTCFFKEGQHVKKDDVLAKIDPRLFRARWIRPRPRRRRMMRRLWDCKRISIGSARSDQRASRRSRTSTSNSQVDNTKATVAADEAAIETAQTQLDYTDIKAPSDGAWACACRSRQHRPCIGPGLDRDAGANATSRHHVHAAGADPRRRARAQRRGAVEAVAYDRDNRNVLSVGTLQTIDNVIDPATASYRLKASFPNADERLWPGEFVNVRLLVDTRAKALVVPNTAIQRGPKACSCGP